MSAGTLLAYWIASLLIGAALLWLGIRGRRVGEHPTCRRCGFDLRGLPGAAERCPECGAGLAKKNAIARGRRRRRIWAAALGALALFVSGAFATGWGVRQFSGVNWNANKPLFLLKWEAKEGGAASLAAVGELTKRLSMNTVQPADLTAVVDHGLSLAASSPQGHMGIEWNVLFSQIGQLQGYSPEQKRRLARLTPMLEPRIRSPIRRGEEYRLETGSSFRVFGANLRPAFELRSVSVDEKPIELTAEETSGKRWAGTEPRPADFDVGVHQVRAVWHIHMRDGHEPDAAVIDEWDETRDLTLEVLAADSDDPRLLLTERAKRQEDLHKAVGMKKLPQIVTIEGKRFVETTMRLAPHPYRMRVTIGRQGDIGVKDATFMEFFHGGPGSGASEFVFRAPIDEQPAERVYLTLSAQETGEGGPPGGAANFSGAYMTTPEAGEAPKGKTPGIIIHR